MIGLTYDDVKSLKPCSDSFKRVSKLLGGAEGWNGNKIDAAKAREAGCTLDDIVWAASALARKDKDVERRLRLWMADCAAHVLHIYEKTEKSDAPRKAIIATRQMRFLDLTTEWLASHPEIVGYAAFVACIVFVGMMETPL